MIPAAIISHYIIPPNILTNIALTLGCELKISNPVFT
jgi:hypothetical protein